MVPPEANTSDDPASGGRGGDSAVDVPVPSDPVTGDAAIDDPPAGPLDAGAPPVVSDSGAAGAPSDATVPPPADAGEPPPADAGSTGGLLDGIRDLLANNPSVREAAALRRIMTAISGGGTPANVKNAVDALGDVNCLNNARTCVAVCGWAVLNCNACAADTNCMAELSQNCRSTCQ